MERLTVPFLTKVINMKTYKDSLHYIVVAGIWLAVLVYFTGCAQLIGIKRYKSGDTVIDFNTGIGFAADVTQSDTLNNQRGIAPGQ